MLLFVIARLDAGWMLATRGKLIICNLKTWAALLVCKIHKY